MEGEIRLEPREAVERLFRHFPINTEAEIADALAHVKRKFFKTLFASATQRLKITGRRGLINHLVGTIFREREKPAADRLQVKSWSKVFRVHEYGGTITAKGKQLAVPLREALKKVPGGTWSGGVLFWKGRLKARFRGEKSGIKGLVGYFDRRRGKYYLGLKRGEAGILPLFVLKRQVRIPARLGFFKTWNELQPFANDRLNQALQRAARKTEQAVPKISTGA